jgi:hypothetical protein
MLSPQSNKTLLICVGEKEREREIDRESKREQQENLCFGYEEKNFKLWTWLLPEFFFDSNDFM